MSVSRIYLDHNAREPLAAAAHDAMVKALSLVGNPSSPHAEGQAARASLEQARVQLANAMDADPRHITFTSGATEAIHHAIHGALLAKKQRNIVLTRTEHHAAKDEVERLVKSEGAHAHFVDVEPNGIIKD